MTFTVLDVREVFGRKEAVRIMCSFHSNSGLKRSYKTVYVPFTSRTGVRSEQRQELAVYELQDLIDLYEFRLTSPRHRHVAKRAVTYLEIVYKIKHHVENVRKKTA